MLSPILVVQDDLEMLHGVDKVRHLFGDTRGIGINIERLQICCGIASDEARAILIKAWPDESSLQALVLNDRAVWAGVVNLAMAAGMLGRGEWTVTDGTRPSPYDQAHKDAIARLEALASAQIRSVAESNGAGKNPHIRAGIVRQREKLFTPNNGQPRRGGY